MESFKEGKVFVIILNYNHLDELIITIKSFINQNYNNLEIVVVDNASTDNSISWVRENYPHITIIENKVNLGWSGGNNVGIKYAMENKADFVLLANNDLYFNDSSIIETLVSDLDKLEKENIYVAGPKVNFYPNMDKNHNEGWILYPKGENKGKFFNVFRKDCKPDLPSAYRYVDSTDGCFFMINTKLFNTTGLLNDALFLYADEVEFSIRAWKEGFKSVINRNLTIYHKVGTSSIPNSPLSIYYRTRNLLYIIKQFNNTLYYKALFLKGCLKLFWKILTSKNSKVEFKFRQITALKKGVFDGLFNKLGPLKS